MARYISLLRFTEQGAKAMNRSTSRAQDFAKSCAKLGVTVEAEYWTVGPYDGVVILSGDERKVLGCLAELSALGNVRTESMQAFVAPEFEAILPK